MLKASFLTFFRTYFRLVHRHSTCGTEIPGIGISVATRTAGLRQFSTRVMPSPCFRAEKAFKELQIVTLREHTKEGFPSVFVNFNSRLADKRIQI